jgi:hypothetical protein
LKNTKRQKLSILDADQGDQIGRIFAQRVIVKFSQYMEAFSKGHILGPHFFHDLSFALISTQNGLGCTLGDFLPNSSGHPDADAQ